MVVAPDRLPQPGEHAAPLAISFQLTPLLVESFCTVAFTTKGLVPAFTEVKEFVMVIAMAAVMVNVSKADLLLLATEVAVIAGALFGEAGAALGGVYVTDVVVACESDPQVGEHADPLAVRLQLTPLLVESFCTVAVKEIAAVSA